MPRKTQSWNPDYLALKADVKKKGLSAGEKASIAAIAKKRGISDAQARKVMNARVASNRSVAGGEGKAPVRPGIKSVTYAGGGRKGETVTRTYGVKQGFKPKRARKGTT